MPYEVYPIKDVRSANFVSDGRTVEDVSRDISNAYNNAALKGGRIIASHAFPSEHLMLVAEIPTPARVERLEE